MNYFNHSVGTRGSLKSKKHKIPFETSIYRVPNSKSRNPAQVRILGNAIFVALSRNNLWRNPYGNLIPQDLTVMTGEAFTGGRTPN
jgi:hypothetical protein